MTEATSPLLNRPLRTQAEVIRDREIRDEEMQGGRGDATTEDCDMLTHFADLLNNIRHSMMVYDQLLLGDYIAQLSDAADDMMTQRQRIEEEERNNR